MQKRENFYLTVLKLETNKWVPAPRECATMTAVKNQIYLQGGMNNEVKNEVIKLIVNGF